MLGEEDPLKAFDGVPFGVIEEDFEESPRPDFSLEVGDGLDAALDGSWRFMVKCADVDVGSIRRV